MKHTAIIDANNIVLTTLSTDALGSALIPGAGQQVIDVTDTDIAVGIVGSQLVAGVFVKPVIVEGVPTYIGVTKLPTKLEFFDRFTDAEQVAIYDAAKTVTAIQVWLDKFKLASDIDVTDPRTIAGINALEAAGLLTAGRAAEILV